MGVLLSSKTVNERGSDKKIKLQELPYAHNALEPYMSEKTIQFHYGKHLATYVDNTNKQKEGTEFENMSVEEIMLKAEGGLFNNAAQVFNHYFQFEALQAYKAENMPTGNIKAAIEKEFGSLEEFKNKFAQAAITLFGSGYAWLVVNTAGKLEIVQTKNAENPLKEDKKPLINLDVWEHAYYLDVQNMRAKYVENFWNILNWDAIEKRFNI
ncbi:superoxide dismutase [Odoribacter sp. OttesenSCG-928-G04]|nr:superoxide dismutase [Odoribacter sp. OttesenSCG-928-G04]